MPENFYLDPEGLEADTKHLRSRHDVIAAGFAKLNSELDAHRNCWGTDDIGKAFGEKYTASETTLLADGKVGVQNFSDIADVADDWSETFQGVDATNAKRIDREYEPKEK